MFLDRSKSCTLFLKIIAQSSAEEIPEDTLTDLQHDSGVTQGIDDLCDILIPHISRCRNILFYIDDHFTSLLDALHMHLRNQGAPLLESLFLQAPRLSHSPPQPMFTFGAPMLSYIHLLRASILCHRPPFHHVVTLHLDAEGLVFSQCVAVASQCPLLETLAIYGDIEEDAEMQPLVLPHLRSLELCGDMGIVAYVLLSIQLQVSNPS
jgi:hypothetical protein